MILLYILWQPFLNKIYINTGDDANKVLSYQRSKGDTGSDFVPAGSLEKL